MIAKLVVWGRDREAARRRLAGALAGTEIVGLATNRNFLAALTAHPEFAAEKVDTGFIARHRAALVPSPASVPETVTGLAALGVILQRQREAAEEARRSADSFSPWHLARGWRLNDEGHHVVRLRDAVAGEIAVTVHFRGAGLVVDLPGGSLAAQGTLRGARLDAVLGGVRHQAVFLRQGDELTLVVAGYNHVLTLANPLAEAGDSAAGSGNLTAPMPGKIVALRVTAGATVKRGAPLLVLEAMKMEHTIAAPADGVVERLRYKVGDQVEEGAELVVFKAAEG